jgi:hypothetical protein
MERMQTRMLMGAVLGGLTTQSEGKCELGAKGKECSDDDHMLWFENYLHKVDRKAVVW